MEETNYLLTDEFLSFANKVKEIHEAKKAKKAELKAFFEKTQAELKALDLKAKELEEEFNKWKKTPAKTEE